MFIIKLLASVNPQMEKKAGQNQRKGTLKKSESHVKQKIATKEEMMLVTRKVSNSMFLPEKLNFCYRIIML